MIKVQIPCSECRVAPIHVVVLIDGPIWTCPHCGYRHTRDCGGAALADDLGIPFSRRFSVELAITPQRLDEVLSLRYRVYCCERLFEDADSFPDGRERDAYDGRSVHALVRCRTSNQCIAAVRLVLADAHAPAAAFPMEVHCGEAMPSTGLAALADIPRTQVAEISRLAISRDCRQLVGKTPDTDGAHGVDPNAKMNRRVLAHIIAGLFTAILRLSAEVGITYWLAAMEPALLRLLKRYGICFPHVGAAIEYHGWRKPVVAQASTLIDGMLAARPDVWDLITDSGAVLPPCPTTAGRQHNTITPSPDRHRAGTRPRRQTGHSAQAKQGHETRRRETAAVCARQDYG